MCQAMNVNFIDAEEYPSTTEIQKRCESMLWYLFNGDKAPRGTAEPSLSSEKAL